MEEAKRRPRGEVFIGECREVHGMEMWCMGRMLWSSSACRQSYKSFKLR